MVRAMPESAALGRATRGHYQRSSSPDQRGGSGCCPALIWVRQTGRLVDLNEEPWLRGPIGEADIIGPEYLDRLEEKHGQTARVKAAGDGTAHDYTDLHDAAVDPARVGRGVTALQDR